MKPEEQLEKWEELSNAHNIPRDRFLVVPKLYLSKDPVLFAQTLKLIALSPNFTELKDKVNKIIKSATSTANNRVNAINIYDLEHIVFRVSDEEAKTNRNYYRTILGETADAIISVMCQEKN